jgi:hypothetical protein
MFNTLLKFVSNYWRVDSTVTNFSDLELMCKEHVFFTKPTYSYNEMPYTCNLCNFFSKRHILKVASYVVTYDMICIHA